MKFKHSNVSTDELHKCVNILCNEPAIDKPAMVVSLAKDKDNTVIAVIDTVPATIKAKIFLDEEKAVEL